MKKENLELGHKIQRDLSTVEYNLKCIKNTEQNPSASDFMYYGSGISPKVTEEIRGIAIKALTNKRRSLQRQFNKL